VGDAVTELVEQWRRQGVPLNPGASAEQLLRLRALLGVDLPSDVVRYFSLADGMVDPAPDASMAHFWSIPRIVSPSLVRDGRDSVGAYRDTAFADILIDSWHFFFRARHTGGLSIVVGASDDELQSLEALCRRYVDDPASLHLMR